MLNTALRIDSGLTYGAGATVRSRPRSPARTASASYTQTESTAQAVDLALATLEKLRGDGLDAADARFGEELHARVSSRRRSRPMDSSPAGSPTCCSTGSGTEDVDEYAQRVAAVDAAAVRSAIERAFPKPADLAIVLIGDAGADPRAGREVRARHRDEDHRPEVRARRGT